MVTAQPAARARRSMMTLPSSRARSSSVATVFKKEVLGNALKGERRRERRTPRYNSKTKQVTPQSLVNSSHMREHKYILIVSRTQHRGKKKLNYTNERRSRLFLPCRVCVHYISPIRANSISRLKNKRRTQLRNAKNASAIIIVTCLRETNVFKLNRISASCVSH